MKSKILKVKATTRFSTILKHLQNNEPIEFINHYELTNRDSREDGWIMFDFTKKSSRTGIYKISLVKCNPVQYTFSINYAKKAGDNWSEMVSVFTQDGKEVECTGLWKVKVDQKQFETMNLHAYVDLMIQSVVKQNDKRNKDIIPFLKKLLKTT